MKKNTMKWMVAAVLLARWASADESAVNVFRVSDQVWIDNPPNFSMNVRVGAFSPWASEQKQNQWVSGAGFEPIAYRYPGIADAGGEDWLEHSTSPGLHFWDSARSGLWDGAEVDIYRSQDVGMKLVRTAKVKKSVCGRGTENKLYFTEKGPAVERGDMYVLRATRFEINKTHFNSNFFYKGWDVSYGQLQVENGRWEIDPENPAPEGNSTASLKVTYDAAGTAWQWYVINKPGWNQFNKGKSYRCQVWLRQSDVKDGKVLIKAGTYAQKLCTVGDEWEKFEFDVPVENPMAPAEKEATAVSRFEIKVSGPGTVWADNLLVYQTDVKPFALFPSYVNALKEFKPHTLRYWAMLTQNSLEGVLNRGVAQRASGTVKGRVDGPDGYTLDVFLNLCAEVGADPWIILHPFYTREELQRLMEYLAAPADQGAGKLRAAHGRVEPWTKTFTNIYFECANEAWNSIFTPLAWPNNPVLYSHIADRLFLDVKASPFYQPEKFRLIANGWDGGLKRGFWTPDVVENCKQADMVDVAHYFGGWEKGTGGEGGDTVFADKLLSTPIEMERKMLTALGLNSDFPRRMALALAAEAKTSAALLAGYKSTQKWTDSQASAVRGKKAAEALMALCETDTLWAQEIDKGYSRYVETADNPLRFLGNTAIASHPKAKETIAQWLGVDADAVEKMAGVINVIGNTTLKRFTEVLQAKPERIDSLLANKNLTWGTATQEVEAVRVGGQCGWSSVNVIRLAMERRMRELARQGDSETIKAMEETLNPSVLSDGVKLASSSLASQLRKTRMRRGDMLLFAMQKDPSFAQEIYKALGEGSDLFMPLSRQMASELAVACAKSLKNINETALVMWPCLPKELQKKAIAVIQIECEKPGLAMDVVTRKLLIASYACWAGDDTAFKRFAEDPVVHKALSAGFSEAFVDTILQMALQNAALGDRLTEAVMLVPSGKSAKSFAIYEAGPGYALPGPGKPPNEDDENIGKSLALGTATLDMMIMCLTYGASPAAYYDFKTGPYWSTHNNPIDMIPYPSWLAMQMRNVYCKGDLLRVEPVSVKTVDVADKEIIKTTNDGKGSKAKVEGRAAIPMVKCYAFKDGNRYSYMLLNRSFSENQSVKLELPYKPSKDAMLYKLTDPDLRANNRTAYNVKISEEKVGDFAATYTVDVPPGSVIVLVNEKNDFSPVISVSDAADW